MKAIVLKEFGDVSKLMITEVSIPDIKENEVLINIKAISINPVDVRTRAGSAMANYLKDFDPIILGWDISGIVTKVGNKVSLFKIGDEVFGMVNFVGHGKGYAEYVAAPEQHLAIKPINQTFEQAAAGTLAALTAWQRLVHFAKIHEGSKILVQAASGGVGHYAVQIAKYFKSTVIGVSSRKNREFVLGLGADNHIAYDEENIEDTINDMDVVIDAFAHESLYQSLKLVKRGGTIISLLPFISEDLLKKAEEKEVRIHYELVKSNGPDMNSIANLMDKGVIVSHVSKKYSFDQMREAHLELERGKTVGKLIVTI